MSGDCGYQAVGELEDRAPPPRDCPDACSRYVVVCYRREQLVLPEPGHYLLHLAVSALQLEAVYDLVDSYACEGEYAVFLRIAGGLADNHSIVAFEVFRKDVGILSIECAAGVQRGGTALV